MYEFSSIVVVGCAHSVHAAQNILARFYFEVEVNAEFAPNFADGFFLGLALKLFPQNLRTTLCTTAIIFAERITTWACFTETCPGCDSLLRRVALPKSCADAALRVIRCSRSQYSRTRRRLQFSVFCISVVAGPIRFSLFRLHLK